MERHDLERIQFVTRHFGELKGLAGKVPFGLFVAVHSLGWLFGFAWEALFLVAAGLGSFGLSRLAQAYYDRRFGYVETTTMAGRPRSRISAYILDGPPLRSIAVLTVGISLLFVPVAIAAASIHSISCILWGGWLLVSWARKRCPLSQAYYPVLVLLLLAFARWNGGPISERSFSAANDIACGVVLVVVGLLDHWQLVLYLEPLDESALSALEEESR